MAKLPREPNLLKLAKLTPPIITLKAGTLLWRIYFRGGDYPTLWNVFRYVGPIDARFDHHAPESSGPTLQDRGVLYAAKNGLTCFAEVFQRFRVIDRAYRDPWLVAFKLANPARLLDLTDSFPTKAGASMALMTGSRSVARTWSKAFYETFSGIEGIYYPSSMHGNKPAIVLNERVLLRDVLPPKPSFNRALSDNTVLTIVRNAALDIGYGML